MENHVNGATLVSVLRTYSHLGASKRAAHSKGDSCVAEVWVHAHACFLMLSQVLCGNSTGTCTSTSTSTRTRTRTNNGTITHVR